MAATFKCPKCQTKHTVTSDEFGNVVTCACGAKFIAAAPAPAPQPRPFPNPTELLARFTNNVPHAPEPAPPEDNGPAKPKELVYQKVAKVATLAPPSPVQLSIQKHILMALGAGGLVWFAFTQSTLFGLATLFAVAVTGYGFFTGHEFIKSVVTRYESTLRLVLVPAGCLTLFFLAGLISPVLGGLLVIGLLGYGVVLLFRSGGGDGNNFWKEYLGGWVLKSSADFSAQSKKTYESDRFSFTWGGAIVADKWAPYHFCIVGATGSGKTLSIRLLMEDVLSQIESRPDARAAVYDAKRDTLSILAGMKLKTKIHLLNPFDARGVAWDIAADVRDSAAAKELAALLIPKTGNETQKHFIDAPRLLLTQLAIALYRRSKKWTLRDLMIGARKKYLKPILQSDPDTWEAVADLFDAESYDEVMSSLTTPLGELQPVAAAWSMAKNTISFEKWNDEKGIIVLGTDPKYAEQMNAINGLLVKRLSQTLLCNPETHGETAPRRSWIFLDEFRGANKLEGLDTLLREGRSKGVCVVIGFQDIGGLKEAYGEHVAGELTGMCQQKAFFRLEDPDTAEWASKFLGEEDVREWSTSWTSGRSGKESTSSTSTQAQRVSRRIVTPDDLKKLSPPSPERGLTGYYSTSDYGRYENTYSSSFLKRGLSSPDKETANFIPREFPDVLPPWTAKDLERLGLTEVLANIKEPTPNKANATNSPPVSPPESPSLFKVKRFTS